MRRFDVGVEHEDELTPREFWGGMIAAGVIFFFMVLGVQFLNWLWS